MLVTLGVAVAVVTVLVGSAGPKATASSSDSRSAHPHLGDDGNDRGSQCQRSRAAEPPPARQATGRK
jgi:hypothetical protein